MTAYSDFLKTVETLVQNTAQKNQFVSTSDSLLLLENIEKPSTGEERLRFFEDILENGFKQKLGYFQRKLAQEVVRAMAPVIVGDQWNIIGERICKERGWDDIPKMVLGSAGRRFGKSWVIARCMIARTETVIKYFDHNDVQSVFSIGKRASGGLRKYVLEGLQERNLMQYAFKCNDENVFLSCNQNVAIAYMNFYPSNPKVCIIPLSLFDIFLKKDYFFPLEEYIKKKYIYIKKRNFCIKKKMNCFIHSDSQTSDTIRQQIGDKWKQYVHTIEYKHQCSTEIPIFPIVMNDGQTLSELERKLEKIFSNLNVSIHIVTIGILNSKSRTTKLTDGMLVKVVFRYEIQPTQHINQSIYIPPTIKKLIDEKQNINNEDIIHIKIVRFTSFTISSLIQKYLNIRKRCSYELLTLKMYETETSGIYHIEFDDESKQHKNEVRLGISISRCISSNLLHLCGELCNTTTYNLDKTLICEITGRCFNIQASTYDWWWYDDRLSSEKTKNPNLPFKTFTSTGQDINDITPESFQTESFAKYKLSNCNNPKTYTALYAIVYNYMLRYLSKERQQLDKQYNCDIIQTAVTSAINTQLQRVKNFDALTSISDLYTTVMMISAKRPVYYEYTLEDDDIKKFAKQYTSKIIILYYILIEIIKYPIKKERIKIVLLIPHALDFLSTGYSYFNRNTCLIETIIEKDLFLHNINLSYGAKYVLTDNKTADYIPKNFSPSITERFNYAISNGMSPISLLLPSYDLSDVIFKSNITAYLNKKKK